MKKEITIELNSASIRKAIEQLNNYKNKVLKNTEIFVKKLSEKGVEIAQTKVIEMNAVMDGDLFGSIHLVKEGNCAYIVRADSSHAVYVEFGTGSIGAEDGYPGKVPEGMNVPYTGYMTGNTIFTTIDGRTGWYFPMKDGTWRFTEGMAARPFMHDTAVDLIGIVERTAKEVFG